MSFRFAINGVKKFFREEHNARIHFAATVAVFIIASLLPLSSNEVITLVIVTGFVWAAEIFNTAIEKLMDHISPEYHPSVKIIKDMAAAAVLIAAATALICAAIIFIPKLF